MKILVVCQYYYPEPFRITDICEEMVKRGHDVSVITGIPNYPKGFYYDGYGVKEKRDEVINGVKIHRCFTVERKSGAIRRFLNYYSFAASSKKYVKKLKEEFDVVFVYQLSPVMMADAAIAYKKKFGKKIVLYCLDMWPESLVAGGIKRNSFIYRHYKKVSEKVYRQADSILVTSKSFSDYFSEVFGINNVGYLPQYAEGLFSVKDCKKTPDGYIDLMFAGNIGVMQSVKTIIEAAALTKDEQKLRWHIVGDGSEYDNVREMAKDLPNVFFHGKKPLAEMPRYYAMADAMLITMGKDPIISYTLPGKTQSYMAAGKPIIGAVDGETSAVIKEADCGYCGEAENAVMLADNVKKFIALADKEKLSVNAFNYYRNNFSKDKFFDELFETFGDVKG